MRLFLLKIMYLILGVLASDVVIFRFNPSSDNLYVPLSSPEIILYFIVLLWVADKEMTTVYPPSEIDKRQTSPNANVTKVTTVSVDIFMFLIPILCLVLAEVLPEGFVSMTFVLQYYFKCLLVYISFILFFFHIMILF